MPRQAFHVDGVQFPLHQRAHVAHQVLGDAAAVGRDPGGVPQAVIEELASESYAVYSEAKREVERLLEEALPGTARAYLEQLGYDAQQPEGGDGAWN